MFISECTKVNIANVVFSALVQNCGPQENHNNDSNTYVIDSIYRFTSIFTAVGARGKLCCGFTGVRRIEFAILIAHIQKHRMVKTNLVFTDWTSLHRNDS